MGASGSGKSTLMHCLAGLDRPTSGTVVVDGVELSTLDDRRLTELRRDKIGFIFQSFNLLPVLTAEENILLPLSIAGRKPDRAWFDELVETVGLTDRLKHRPVAALRRPGAARRGRAGAHLAPGGHLRRRADRQPRLQGLGRGARAAAPRRRRPRPDGDHGHPRPGGRGGGRPARRAQRRPRRRGPRRRRRRWPDARARPCRGFGARKLRVALTVIAVALGVALISGTYILTDTINKSFDEIFTDRGEGHRRRRSPPATRSRSDDGGARPPTIAGLAARPRPARARRGQGGRRALDGQRRGVHGQGRTHRQRDGRCADLGLLRHAAAVRRAAVRRGPPPEADNQVGLLQSTAKDENVKIGDTIQVVGAAGPRQNMEVVGLAKFGGVSSVGGFVAIVTTLPEAQKLSGKKGFYDEILVSAKSGVAPARAAQPDPADRAAERQRPHRPAAGRPELQGHPRQPRLPAHGAARVRRHLAVRRRVHHLQHVLDHRRAAHARVRAAADPRRLARARCSARCSSRAC